jgi:MraZ protein
VENVDRPPMLIGAYEHTIDDKNRLTLPAKFRESFRDGVVLTRGLDGCVYAYPRAQWERMAESIASRDELRSEVRQMKRYFFAAASYDEPDRQGRVTVPAPLARHASLAREVVVVGVRDHAEVWDRAAWEEEKRQVEGGAEDVARRLASSG